MESTLKYMSNLHKTLINDYRTPDNKHGESCGYIASNIAKILLKENKSPYLAEIKGRIYDGINNEAIIPKPFEGRITWGAHIVCCEDNLAYDPMLGDKPVSIDDYCEKAFEGEVKMKVFVPENEIKEFVSR